MVGLVLRLWSSYERGILPYAGGLLDQPAVVVEGLTAYASAYGSAQRAKAEADERKRQAEARRSALGSRHG